MLVPNGRCGLDRLAAESGAMLRASYGRTTLSKHWHPDILFCHLPCRSPRRHAGSRRRWWRCSAACSPGHLWASEKILHCDMRPCALVNLLHFGGDDPVPTLQVNTASRGQQVQAVAMLGVALAWHSRLEGQPCAAALAAILGDCIQRLLAHFEKSLWERVTGMTRCDHYTTWPQSVPTQYCSRPPGRLPPAFAGLFRGVAVGACDGHHKVCSELNLQLSSVWFAVVDGSAGRFSPATADALCPQASPLCETSCSDSHTHDSSSRCEASRG